MYEWTRHEYFHLTNGVLGDGMEMSFFMVNFDLKIRESFEVITSATYKMDHPVLRRAHFLGPICDSSRHRVK